MAKIVLVLLGGAFGTGLRYFLSIFIYSRVKDPTFPYANLVINVSGSFLIGILAELFETRVLVAPVTRVALLTGVLGGYTTFSSVTSPSCTISWIAGSRAVIFSALSTISTTIGKSSERRRIFAV